MAQCKKCNAPIIWLKTPKGKWMCADEGLVRYKQSETGTKYVVTDRGEVIRCELEFDGLPTGMARIPHWATCPNAEEFRRSRQKSEVEA